MTAPTDRDRIAKLEETVADQAKRLDALEKLLGGIRSVFTGETNGATDREMDHPQYGDPKVTFIPKTWTGEPVAKGRAFSACPPEFLDLLAESYDFFERKNRESGAKTTGGKLKADFDARSARYARGWARRLRAGWVAPEKPSLAKGAAPFGAPAGFGHTPFGGAPVFGGGGNPFAPRGVPMPGSDDDLFGAPPPKPFERSVAAQPPDPNRQREPGDDDDLDFDAPQASAPKAAEQSSGSGAVMLDDDDDDDLPLRAAGGGR